MRAAEVASGEPEALLGERLDDRARRTGRLERGKEVFDRFSDAGVGVLRDRTGGVIDQADG